MTRNLAGVTQTLKTTVQMLKSVDGFMIGGGIKTDIATMASRIKEGNSNAAIEAGEGAIKGSYAILAAFLKHSVVDREGKPSYFTREIENRRDEKYDRDLLDRLEVKRKATEEAVRIEINGSFEKRIETYNATKAELRAVDREHQLRLADPERKKKLEKKARQKQEDEAATARNRARDAAASLESQQALAILAELL